MTRKFKESVESIWLFTTRSNNSKIACLRSQIWQSIIENYPANIYMFKFNNRNTKKRSKLCSKLTIIIPERHHWRHSGVFIIAKLHVYGYRFDKASLRLTQLTFTCSKSTIKIFKKVQNMFKVNNRNTRTTPLTSFWRFAPFPKVSIVDFKQVNVSRFMLSYLTDR